MIVASPTQPYCSLRGLHALRPATRQVSSSLRIDPPLLLLAVGCGLSAAIPFRIRTSAKHTRNPSRIRTSKTQDLKLFRMNTSRKRGRGVGPAHSGRFLGSPAWVSGLQTRIRYNPFRNLPTRQRSSSTLPVAQRWAEQGRAIAIAEGAKTRRGIPGRQVWRVPKLST
jgi:hypothetical protein